MTTLKHLTVGKLISELVNNPELMPYYELERLDNGNLLVWNPITTNFVGYIDMTCGKYTAYDLTEEQERIS